MQSMSATRREVALSAGVLFLALLACGHRPGTIAWKPYSMRMNGSHIADRAVLIGEGDLGVVRSAGGLPAGTMTMRDSEGWSMETIHEYAAQDAAEYGGTHYMAGEWSESTSTAYSAHKIGDSWAVIPHTSVTRTLEFVVIRVPRSGWDRLPAALTPRAFTGPR